MIYRHREGWTLVEVAVVVVVIGVLAGISIPSFLRMKERAWEASTKGNAHTVQLAAEVYAIQHQGRYTGDVTDLQELFPSGEPLTNPFNGDEVVFDGSVGDLFYEQATAWEDYTIKAFGRGDSGDPTVILVLSNGS